MISTLSQIAACPASLPLALLAIAFLGAVAYLAWDAIANAPRARKTFRR